MDTQSAEARSARAFRLGDFLRDQLRNIAPFITLIVLVGFLQHREPVLRLARQSGKHPPAGLGHRDHRRRPDLRHPDRRDRSQRRRGRQCDGDRADVLHRPAGLRQHRQPADARRDRHRACARGLLRARPHHRLRRHPDRHPVLHHDAGDDADRRRRLGGAGARADRLYRAEPDPDARLEVDRRRALDHHRGGDIPARRPSRADLYPLRPLRLHGRGKSGGGGIFGRQRPLHRRRGDGDLGHVFGRRRA